MFFSKRPLDMWVPSANSILYALIALPVVAAVAFDVAASRGVQSLVLTAAITASTIGYLLVERRSARRRNVPLVGRAEIAAHRDAWIASQPLWRLMLLAVLPLWFGWTLFMVQLVMRRPLWDLGPTPWRPMAAGSLIFGLGWAVFWIVLRWRARRQKAG